MNEVNKILVRVYRSGSDCTNNGLTSKVDMLTLGTIESDSDLVIERCGTYVNAVPRNFNSNKWVMCGGNFVFSSDARYKELTKLDYPISVHDRVEEFH